MRCVVQNVSVATPGVSGSGGGGDGSGGGGGDSGTGLEGGNRATAPTMNIDRTTRLMLISNDSTCKKNLKRRFTGLDGAVHQLSETPVKGS